MITEINAIEYNKYFDDVKFLYDIRDKTFKFWYGKNENVAVLFRKEKKILLSKSRNNLNFKDSYLNNLETNIIKEFQEKRNEELSNIILIELESKFPLIYDLETNKSLGLFTLTPGTIEKDEYQLAIIKNEKTNKESIGRILNNSEILNLAYFQSRSSSFIKSGNKIKESFGSKLAYILSCREVGLPFKVVESRRFEDFSHPKRKPTVDFELKQELFKIFGCEEKIEKVENKEKGTQIIKPNNEVYYLSDIITEGVPYTHSWKNIVADIKIDIPIISVQIFQGEMKVRVAKEFFQNPDEKLFKETFGEETTMYCV